MIYMVLYILLWHFIGDFIFQTQEMAQNKSKSNYWLTIHAFTYGKWLLVGSLPILLLNVELTPWICLFILVNIGLHWVTDYFTSRQTSKLWKEQKVHEFFIIIGLDQFIHACCLLLSLETIHNLLQ